MSVIVQKYGGTSVGDIQRIKQVAAKVVKAVKGSRKVVVVVSAMAGETDKLLGMARQVTDRPDDRELDLLLSSGERVSTALLAMAISACGHPAQSFTGRQVGIETTSSHTRARIRRVTGERVRKALDEGKIAVVAGFQGIDPFDDVTTLGRGGSDTTAVALAAALGAEMCEIYTDVDGVYSADPNIVPGARRHDRISYEEMLELATAGAKVLNNRSVEFAKNHRVPLLVKSTFQEGKGTLVTEADAEMERVVVTGVACDKNHVRFTLTGVADRPGVAATVFSKIAEAEVVVDMIVQNVGAGGCTDISFTVPRTDLARAREQVEKVLSSVGAAGISLDEDVARVSIVGAGMQSHWGVAARMFSALASENINILMISTSEIKISCLIERKYAELAVRVLHDTFLPPAEGVKE